MALEVLMYGTGGTHVIVQGAPCYHSSSTNECHWEHPCMAPGAPTCSTRRGALGGGP